MHATGKWPRISWQVSHGHLWLGPVVVAVAGVLASGGFDWSRVALTKAGLLLVLAEVGWENLWWALAGTDWAGPRERWWRWRGPAEGQAVVGRSGTPAKPIPLPYVVPIAPAGQLAGWWAVFRGWWKAELEPQRGGQLGTILVGVPVAMALGAALGTAVLLLTLAALAITQMALFLGPADGRASPLAQAFVQAGVPWLAAWFLFGPPTGHSLAFAAGLVIGYSGLVGVGRGAKGAPAVWWGIGFFQMVVVLLAAGRPAAAAAVGACYFSQLAILVWLSVLGRDSVVRLAQWPFLGAVAIAALIR